MKRRITSLVKLPLSKQLYWNPMLLCYIGIHLMLLLKQLSVLSSSDGSL